MKILESDLSWTADDGALGTDLAAYLKRLSEVKIIDYTKAYASFSPETGMRLLSLFRYWNIIEYYYPYADIMGEIDELMEKSGATKGINL